MKKQALSAVVLVLGGVLFLEISGYGGAGHDHSHDHASEASKEEKAQPATDFLLGEEIKAELGLELGTAETLDIPGSEDLWIAVPTEALTSLSADGKKASVYFSEDPAKDGVPQKFTATEVELGETKAGYVEVKSGLFPGDTVIVKNAYRIRKSGDSEAAEKQERSPEPNSPKGDRITPSAASEPKTVQAYRTKTSAGTATNGRPELRDPAVCDFRCPLEDGVTASVCPDTTAPVCDKGSVYQERSHCDREEYRARHSRSHRSYRRGNCELRR